MTFDISDYDEIQIYITDGWREWYIPKFRLTWVVDEPYITLYWTDTEKGSSGIRRKLELDYQDVSFGYTSPSSAAEIASVLENYIISAFGGSSGATWGSITGTLSDQTDLQAALDAKITDSDAAVGARINAAGNATPNNGDYVATAESGGSLKKITWTNVKAFLKTYFDTVYQATLVSGTNIKTVNGTTLLGSGDLVARDYWININTLSGTITSGATRYFGSILRTAGATAGESKIYFRQAGTITIADIVFFANTIVGSNENISISVRLNNTTDYPVATVGTAVAERVFTNTSINVPIAVNDYIEMKIVTPSWGTQPTGVLITGHLIFIAS